MAGGGAAIVRIVSDHALWACPLAGLRPPRPAAFARTFDRATLVVLATAKRSGRGIAGDFGGGLDPLCRDASHQDPPQRGDRPLWFRPGDAGGNCVGDRGYRLVAAWAENHGLDGDAPKLCAYAIWLLIIGIHIIVTARLAGEKRIAVGSGGDRFLADARGQVLNEFLAEFQKRAQPGQSLTMLPEGPMVNYLARVASPTGYVQCESVVMIMFGPEAIVRALQPHPPDFIGWVNRGPLFDAEYPEFDRQLAVGLRGWIFEHYVTVAAPATPNYFHRDDHLSLQMRLMKRSESEAHDK